eukprot:CAMPEP_0170536958 /NCGR_PEP_ID=MMETSP0209-20121228/102439_1 /TAXON_ID=665100 ORGANISM="Litonotus pictus, Strain P1" /NCGR_SAMPLE_ID=MMETSP0209 /ASSEMBLY_ACC=CAM_ASM_000301 /LENGTH=1179 /DNA_ID=CAMNT_0010838385 /DNA_START=3784 /DNA_END=7319 /DNA_ORIENTATION=-
MTNVHGSSVFSNSIEVEASAVPSPITDAKAVINLTTISVTYSVPNNNGRRIDTVTFLLKSHNKNFYPLCKDIDTVTTCQVSMSKLADSPFFLKAYDYIAVKGFASNSNGPSKIIDENSDLSNMVSYFAKPDTPEFAPCRNDMTSNDILVMNIQKVNNNNNSISSYNIQFSSDEGIVWQDLISTLEMVIYYTPFSPLDLTKEYWFKYKATNEAGGSDYSPILKLKAIDAPHTMEPPIVIYSPVNSSMVEITFKLPINGGSDILGYEMQVLGINKQFVEFSWCKKDPSSEKEKVYRKGDRCVFQMRDFMTGITSLSTGDYLVAKIRAVNEIGGGEFSSSSTPLLLKSAPLKPRAHLTRGELTNDSQIHVRVSPLTELVKPDAHNGFDEVLCCQIFVMFSANNFLWINQNASPGSSYYSCFDAMYTDVDPDKTYTFFFRCTNSIGWSPYSNHIQIKPNLVEYFHDKVYVEITLVQIIKGIVYVTAFSSHHYSEWSVYVDRPSDGTSVKVSCVENYDFEDRNISNHLLNRNNFDAASCATQCSFGMEVLGEAPYNFTSSDEIYIKVQINFLTFSKFSDYYEKFHYQSKPLKPFPPIKGNSTNYKQIEVVLQEYTDSYDLNQKSNLSSIDKEIPGTDIFYYNKYNGNSHISYYKLLCDRRHVNISNETVIRLDTQFLEERFHPPIMNHIIETQIAMDTSNGNHIDRPTLRYDYLCQSYAINQYGESPPSEVTLIQAGFTPGPIKNLKSAYGSTQLEITYDLPSNNGAKFESLMIYMMSNSGRYHKICSFKDTLLTNTITNYCNIDGLLIINYPFYLNKQNTINVYAYVTNKFGTSPYTFNEDKTQVQTLPTTPLFKPIRNLLSNLSQIVLDVKVLDFALEYILEYSTNNSNWNLLKKSSGRTFYYLSFSFSPTQLFYFRYKAKNIVGETVPSPVLELRVEHIPSTMDPPSVQYLTEKPSHIKVGLDKKISNESTVTNNGSNISHYIVKVKSKTGNFFEIPWCIKSRSTSNQGDYEAYKDRLAQECEFSVSIFQFKPFYLTLGDPIIIISSSINGVGEGKYSEYSHPIKLKTPPRKPVTTPFFGNLANKDFITVKVNGLYGDDTGHDEILAYNVVWIKDEMNVFSLVSDDIHIGGNVEADCGKRVYLEYYVFDVQPGKVYKFAYRAKNNFGWGPFSEVASLICPT